MKIGIITRTSSDALWGGDLLALNVIKEGMEAFGHETKVGITLDDLPNYDYFFFTNCTSVQESPYALFKMMGKKYGIIAFYEDFLQHYGPSKGIFNYVNSHLKEETDQGFDFSIERLFENPRLIYYWADSPLKVCLNNYHVVKDADVCFANSPTEASYILNECPQANVKTVLWTSGLTPIFEEQPSDEFLNLTGLKSGEYILQIGRLSCRKNQLSAILATKDLDTPLVLIATISRDFEYQRACLDAALHLRKGPTLLISQQLPTMERGNVRILQMPNAEKLSDRMLHSALAHAGLQLHPAFSEMPGYTYLEAAHLGIPTVASSWASIQDYFTDPKTGVYNLDDRIEYALPYDVAHLKRLVEKKFGARYPKENSHPVFKRSSRDVAREILSHLPS